MPKPEARSTPAREIGKKVVPLKEYFRQSAADFEKQEVILTNTKTHRPRIIPLVPELFLQLKSYISFYNKYLKIH